MGTGVTLQINTAPGDLRYLPHTVPHQMRALAGQADEVLFSLDTHHSRASRYRIQDFEQRLDEVTGLLARLCADIPKARVLRVDYAPQAMRQVARRFLGRDEIPRKAENGSPFYAYLHGLHAAACDFVLHLDADMLFGGGSQTWVAEAVALLQDRPELLACNPLAGPPTAGGEMTAQSAPREAAPYPAFRFDSLSTRVFLLDRRRFGPGGLALPLLRPNLRQRTEAWLNANPPVLALEDSFTALMRARGLFRLDFLGRGPGLWTLHPVYRTERFYRELPALIARIEAGDIPEGQRGDYNLNDALLDLSETRSPAFRARRLLSRLRSIRYGLAGRLRGG